MEADRGGAESGEPVIGKVIEVVKGGLILDLGVRGFLPASLVDIRRVQDLDEFLGKELRCKVIELNRSRNNVVLSRRAVLEDERKEMRQAILDRLNPGDVVEGPISNIVDFGAFVDLDGMDGLIHISELSWSHVNHPSEVLEIGQTVKVKVSTSTASASASRSASSRRSPTRGSRCSTTTARATSSRAASRRSSRSAPSSRSCPASRASCTSPSSRSTTSRTRARSSRRAIAVNVLILEIDGERRRLSLSLKRVEDGMKVRRAPTVASRCTRRPTCSSPRTASRPPAPRSRRPRRRGRGSETPRLWTPRLWRPRLGSPRSWRPRLPRRPRLFERLSR